MGITAPYETLIRRPTVAFGSTSSSVGTSDEDTQSYHGEFICFASGLLFLYRTCFPFGSNIFVPSRVTICLSVYIVVFNVSMSSNIQRLFTDDTRRLPSGLLPTVDVGRYSTLKPVTAYCSQFL